MKLVRYGQAGKEKPGVLDKAGTIRSLEGIIPDIAGDSLSPQSIENLRRVDVENLPRIDAGTRLGPCVGATRHFVAIGLNYSAHAQETDTKLPSEPIIFEKAPTSICGPYDDVMMPRGAIKLDWEVELCVVIGSRARYLEKEKAMDVVAGYCVCNDISERHFQLEREGQWTKGKGCETLGPIGPWLVTKDEVKDVQNLDMFLEVNGEIKQRDNTCTMIFDVAHVVWYCSQFFVMEPGDLITTGTPPGVGLGIKPVPQFLKAGDVMRLGVQGLGEQKQTVVPFKL